MNVMSYEGVMRLLAGLIGILNRCHPSGLCFKRNQNSCSSFLEALKKSIIGLKSYNHRGFCPCLLGKRIAIAFKIYIAFKFVV